MKTWSKKLGNTFPSAEDEHISDLCRVQIDIAIAAIRSPVPKLAS